MKTSSFLPCLTFCAHVGRRALFCGLGLGLTVCAQATVLLDTGFEDPPWTAGTVLGLTAQNGWTGSVSSNVSNGKVQVSNAQAHTGTQSLYLLDNMSGYTASANYAFEETVSAGVLDYWFMKDASKSGTLFQVYFTDGGNVTNFVFLIGNYNNGGEGLYIVSNNTAIASVLFGDISGFNLNTWNNFSIAFDQGAKTLDVSFNGVVALSLTESQAGQIASLSVEEIRFTAGWSSGTNFGGWIDDVKFTAVPEPGTLGVLGGVGVIAAVAVSRRIRRV